MTKWTEGPWFLEGGLARGEAGWLSWFPPAGMPLFEMTPILGPREEVIANATAIAAFPDVADALVACQQALALLLDAEAVKAGVSNMHVWAQCTAAEVAARSALAKARGEA